MPGIFGDNFLSVPSPLATTQYRPTRQIFERS